MIWPSIQFMIKAALKLLLLFAATASLFAQSAPGNRILGSWLTPNQGSTVEIVKCGNAYCGSIKSMTTPKNDEHNADSSLRGRPLIGAQIMTGFLYAGSDTWNGGTLYAPARGKSVSPDLVLTAPDKMEIKVKAGMMSKTVIWTRAK
jgi:uncharacterized protein (DUF2147 family)